MLILKSFLSIVVLTSFALPFPALAQGFLNHQRGLVLVSENNVYRQRLPAKPWQKSPSEEGMTISQSLVFDNWLYFIGSNAGQVKLYFSRYLLDRDSFEQSSADFLELKVVGDQLFLLKIHQDQGQIYRVEADELKPTTGLSFTSDNDIAQLLLIGSEIVFILPQENDTAVFYLEENRWLGASRLNCQEPRIFVKPQPLLICQDGEVYLAQSSDTWVSQAVSLSQTAEADIVLFGQDFKESNLFHLLSDKWYSFVIDPPEPETLLATKVVGRRILLRYSDGWYELLYQDQEPSLVKAAESESELVASGNSSSIFLTGEEKLLSEVPGVYEPISTEGDFNHATGTEDGYLLWLTSPDSGGLMQYAAPPSRDFRRVNPWSSTTSPIRSVKLEEPPYYVSVVTNSGRGNVNLYRSENLQNWSRITLPTKATFLVSIAEARNLSPGTLVEVTGVMSVPPEVVSPEVAYLQDAQAGIQLFLSQSRGQLPDYSGFEIIASGEISSSQAKRIILGSSDELEVMQAKSLERKRVLVNNAQTWLGMVVDLEGTVAKTEQNHLFFEATEQLFKLHFQAAKEVFQKLDRLAVPAVVDWNSSSSQIEAWAISRDFHLLSRLDKTAESDASSSAEVASKPTKTSPSSSKISAAGATEIASATPSTPNGGARPTVIAGATSEKPQPARKQSAQLLAMSLASLAAGILVSNGRRARRYFAQQISG